MYINDSRVRFFILVIFAIIQFGCTAMQVPNDLKFSTLDERHLPVPDLSIKINGLSSCTNNPDSTIRLNSKEPVVVIVHGCFASAARFRALSQVFAFHGQQSVCFNYDDRDSLVKSSGELTEALRSLSSHMHRQNVTLIGHSQGGLIARKALVESPESPLPLDYESLQLTTISSPFSGISAAAHCASSTARVFTLGLVVPICKLISGDKWFEITHSSEFIQRPGELSGHVKEHLKIVTDEANTCRRYDSGGACIEDDYVFSIDEQYFETIDDSPKVKNIRVKAGHAEIVGDHQMQPRKLITLLQLEGIMRATVSTRKEQLEQLLAQLY